MKMRMLCNCSCFKSSLWCDISGEAWRHHFESRSSVHPDSQHQRWGFLAPSSLWMHTWPVWSTRHIRCVVTGLSKAPLALVVRCEFLCSKRPHFWINYMPLLRPPLFLLSFVFLFCLNIKCFRAGSVLAYVYRVFCRTGTCPWYWGLLALLVVTCGHRRVGGLTQQVWSLQSQFSSGTHTREPLGFHAVRREQ